MWMLRAIMWMLRATSSAPTSSALRTTLGPRKTFGRESSSWAVKRRVKGYYVDVKAYYVDVKGYYVHVKGYYVDVKGLPMFVSIPYGEGAVTVTEETHRQRELDQTLTAPKTG
eukprot:241724-Prorocentrum_minimum.AAC.1